MQLFTLEIHGLKAYKDHHIDIRQGRLITLLGRNDAGKSTILNALSLLHNDTLDGDSQKLTKDCFHKDKNGQVSQEIVIVATFSNNSDDIQTVSKKYKLGEDDQVSKPEVEGGGFPKVLFVPAVRDYAVYQKSGKTDPISKLIVDRIGSTPAITNALQTIESNLPPLLENASIGITDFIQQLQPSVSAIEINAQVKQEVALSSIDIRISDELFSLIPISQRGSGTQSNLFVAAFRYFAKLSSEQKIIYCIEEPEAHLHESAQIALIKAFRKIANDGNLVILASHSPVFCNHYDIDIIGHIYTNDAGEAEVDIKDAIDVTTLRSLGWSPSNYLGWNTVLIVEDEEQVKMLDRNVEIHYGTSKTLSSLGIKAEIALKTPDILKLVDLQQILEKNGINLSFLKDGDKASEAVQWKSKGLKNTIVLKKMEIENYLPYDILRNKIVQLSGEDGQLDYSDQADIKNQFKQLTGDVIAKHFDAMLTEVDSPDEEIISIIDALISQHKPEKVEV